MSAKRKVLIIILFTLGCIYFLHLTNRFVLSGWVRDLPSFTGFIQKAAVSDVRAISDWISVNIKEALGVLFGAVSGILGLGKLASSKISQARTAKSQAEDKLVQMQIQARKEISEVREQAKTEIGELNTTVQDQKTELDRLRGQLTEFDELKAANQRLSSDLNLMGTKYEDVVKKLGRLETPPVA